MKSLKNLFSLDLRSLALVRVCLGLLCFIDIANRIPQINTFYSDHGILPRFVLIDQFELAWRMSLLDLNGSSLFAFGLAIIGLVSSLLFMLGWRTKLNNFISWIVIMSFQARFPEVNHGGDNLLRMLLLWIFFLPSNTYYSVDSVLSGQTKKESSYFGFSSFSWITQILYVYVFTFLYKWDPSWYKNFDSVYYAMSLDMFTTTLGKGLLSFPLLMQFLSFFTFALEGLGPIMLLIPWKNSFFRGLNVCLFFALHIGIWLTLELGNFAPACLIMWMAMIPTTFWESKIFKKHSQGQSTIYYDPDCGFCRKFCFLVKDFLFLPNLHVVSGETNPDILKIIQTKKSWVFINEQGMFIRWNALSQMLLKSNFFIFCWLGKLFSIFNFNFIYNFISSKRGYLGRILNLIGFENINSHEGRFKKIILSFFIFITLAWNIEGITNSKYFKIESPFDEIVFALQLNQQWNMFAPRPMRDDGWFITEAMLASGVKWDILNNHEIKFQKPDAVQNTYPSSQWRKFMLNLRTDDNGTYKLWFGRYLCRRWNDTHPDSLSLTDYKLSFMRETTPQMGSPLPAPAMEVVWNHHCK